MSGDTAALPSTWAGAAWIARAEDPQASTDPVGPEEDRPQETMGLHPPVHLRREFTLDAAPSAARLWLTARGVYEASVNGMRVGDHVLAPGFTDYHSRQHIQEFDVTGLLIAGRNTIGVVVADGWYCGFVGFDRGRQARLWGERPSLLARLEVDGITICSDGDWSCATGAPMYADLQMGEMHDARRDLGRWTESGFDASSWSPVHVVPMGADDPPLTASPAPPIRVTARRPPQSIVAHGSGWIVDFGQNLVGTIELRVREGGTGDRVHVRHGEMLDSDGSLYTANLRSAAAHDLYVCAGSSVEWFRPRFTFHGFRYVEITGYPTSLEADDIVAVVIHTDVERIGWFGSSDPRLTRLHENVDWTLRGNLLDVPSDCPQRDERLGWLGDAQLIMPAATFLRDLGGFLVKWTRDVRDGQDEDGAFPDVAPRANLRVAGAPGWADAGAIVPWVGYLATARRDLLEENVDAIRAFVGHLESTNKDLIRRRALNRNYGDWLNLDDPTPRELIATAYFALTVESSAHIEEALGNDRRARDARDLWGRIRAAFAAEFVGSDGTVLGGSQTAYAMALHLDLIPDHLRTAAAAHLAARIRDRGHLTTGIHGTRFLAPALSDAGLSRIAYDLVLADTNPSWLFSLRHDATTVWERWDGWSPERGFHNPRMNSFNHYALGSVAEWLQRYSAGLLPSRRDPGYRHVVVRPHPDPRLTWAAAQHRAAGGEVAVRWRRHRTRFELSVTLPAGTTAEVHVPASTRAAEASAHVRRIDSGLDSWVPFVVGEGVHRFSTTLRPDWTPDAVVSIDRLTQKAPLNEPLRKGRR